jgi:hypothetical protein
MSSVRQLRLPMKSARKRSLPTIDDALQIVETGIEKIVGDIGRERATPGKSTRPRGPKAKTPPRRAA